MNCFALISSLPALKRDENPFYTTESFLLACSNNLGKTDFERLSKLNLLSDNAELGYKRRALAAKYLNWEESFRNAIVKIRASKYSRDPAPSLREVSDTQTDAEKAVSDAYATAGNPLERERKLDDARWNKLSELETGLLFSNDLLCSYKLKLEILEKWKRRTDASAAENLDRAASEIRKPASAEKAIQSN